MSINSATVSGNLTKDAELRTAASGIAVLKFRVAVNERVKEGDAWKDKAYFFSATMFGKRAEAIAPYMLKGTKVAVSGKLKIDEWEQRDGTKRTDVGIVVDEVDIMSKREEKTVYSDDDLPF